MKKKVLFVSTNDWVPWGGSEELWTQTALNMIHKNIQVTVSVANWQPVPEGIQQLENASGEIIRRIQPQYRFIQKVALKYGLLKMKDQYEEALSNNPDLVVINQGDILGGLGWAKECAFKNIPYVIIVNLVNELRILKDGQIDLLIKSFSQALKVFFVSKNNFCLFEKMTGALFTNAEIIQNPYKPIAELPAYPSVKEGCHLAFVASLNSFHKGHDILFEVLEQQKWKERDLNIHLYGTGPNEQYLNRLKKMKGLSRVYFEGFKNINEIWPFNNALLLCSRMEGQSLALIEAFYCNRMAIVTNTGNASELVEDGVTGFLAAYPYPEFVDDALERAWNERDIWEKMGIDAGNKIRSIIKQNPVETFSDILTGLI